MKNNITSTEMADGNVKMKTLKYRTLTKSRNLKRRWRPYWVTSFVKMQRSVRTDVNEEVPAIMCEDIRSWPVIGV